MLVTRYIYGGSTRCVQASFRMVIDSLFGTDPGQDAADRLTGYVEGRGTWQFRMLLAFSDYRLHTVDHEEFDVQGFIKDPESAIRKQVEDEDAIRSIIAETDVDAERAALLKCIASPFVKFIETVPSFDDLKREVNKKNLVLANVDLQVLKDKPEREGHMIIIEDFLDETIVLHDPGPGGGLGIKVPLEKFYRAWTSPSTKMANYISVSKEK